MGELVRVLKRILVQCAEMPVEHDPEWTSPAEIGLPDADGMIRWRPIPMMPPPDFTDVESAIGFPLHPDAKTYYGSFWGWGTEFGSHSGEPVFLAVPWNMEELNRIKSSIVAHVRCQLEISARPTVFVAGTGSDLYFGIDNCTGEVLLEEPNHPIRGVVAPSLLAFLNAL